MANYDSKPSVYEANGDGSFMYRWNFREVNSSNSSETNEEEKTNWECNEVVVWATVTREKLIAAVLASLWSSDYETELMNDYNAAREGFLDESYIQRYRDFLAERTAVKEQISRDYAEFIR
jgi:hypothetical protein